MVRIVAPAGWHLHRGELQAELGREVDLRAVERRRSILLATTEELQRQILKCDAAADKHRSDFQCKVTCRSKANRSTR